MRATPSDGGLAQSSSQGRPLEGRPPQDQRQHHLGVTPYDGVVERVARKWRDREQQGFGFKTLSMTKSVTVAQFVERAASLYLIQDWT